MSEPTPFKYRAFISYSHADTDWAKWLHRGLESFRIDKDLAGRETATGIIPTALRPIFRDRDDFTAGHTLTEQTLTALEASAALIVICSPSSAKSLYVNEEIRLFKSRHPGRPVIPLIVAGKPGDQELECFPPALKFKLDAKGRVTKRRVELLAADAREQGDGKDLALAKVIAGLLGLSSDDVFRRAERERRAAARRRRRVQAIVGVLAVLLVAAGVGWLNQDYLREQYYWWAVMDPTVLTAEQERALKPGDEFSECRNVCPRMVVVPPGKFQMGSAEAGAEDRERPQHEVTVAKQFAVGKYEVLFADWDACFAAGGCPRAPDLGWGRGTRPAIQVNWNDAKRYVAWLSRLTGNTYRLLTESEWEYAARAGTTTFYSFGNDKARLSEYAWYLDDPSNKTQPVGEKKPNGFGIHDMHGNVWEWVEDIWHDTYDGAPSDASAWVEGDDVYERVTQGGSWANDPEKVRTTIRDGANPDVSSSNDGFRVARDLAQ